MERLIILASLTLFILFTAQPVAAAVTIGKWQRYVITLPNTSYTGNPFELPVDATFTHIATHKEIVLPGYYAGHDKWKIGFMPTLEGDWTYVTSSDDAELDGIKGKVNCVASALRGILKADTEYPRKWRFEDGAYAVPIALRIEFFSEPASPSQFDSAADFMQANNLTLMETRLLEEEGQFGGRHDFIFKGDWRQHRFDLEIWDRMEARMNALAARGLGAHIMFYSDDAGKPPWPARSGTEQLVIRYVIARLAGYPVIFYNTGIDIVEYRDQSWVDWFGDQIRGLDPYGHPVSSRYGGGSGDMVMREQSFDSRGNQLAKIHEMTGFFDTADVPVSLDDAWGENRSSHPHKYFRPADIRRSFWKAVIAGGLGGLIRGSDGFFDIKNLPDDLKSGQWLKLINPFVTSRLGETFGAMVPEPSLVSNGYCLSDPHRERILYFLPGIHDQWDRGVGGNVRVKLTGLAGQFKAIWFDTRSGAEISAGILACGSDHELTPPGDDDWVLLLVKLADEANPTQSTVECT